MENKYDIIVSNRQKYNTLTVEVGCIYYDINLLKTYFVTDIVIDELGLKWVKCYDMKDPNNPDDEGLWPLKSCFSFWKKIQ